MAERTDAVPQSLDESAVADLIKQLNVVGKVGLLNVSDTIVPVYLVEQRRAFTFPLFKRSEVQSNGPVLAVPANTTLAATGPLPEGGYDISIMLSAERAAGELFIVKYFDATPTQVKSWHVMAQNFVNLQFGFRLNEGEAFEVANVRAVSLTEWTQAAILAAPRTS